VELSFIAKLSKIERNTEITTCHAVASVISALEEGQAIRIGVKNLFSL
jgi:hypothetical protein